MANSVGRELRRGCLSLSRKGKALGEGPESQRLWVRVVSATSGTIQPVPVVDRSAQPGTAKNSLKKPRGGCVAANETERGN